MAAQDKSIIVATDGSEPASRAVKFAAGLAKKLDCELIILHVISYKKIGYWAFVDSHFKKEMILAAEKILDAAKAVASHTGVVCHSESREVETSPYLAIIQFLEEHKEAQMIVLGDKGHDFVEHHVLGSTTDRLIHEVTKRQLPVPVLVVPYIPGNNIEI